MSLIDEPILAEFYKSLNPDIYGPGSDSYFATDTAPLGATSNSADDATIVRLEAGGLALTVTERGSSGSIKVSKDFDGDFNVREGAKLLYDSAGSLTPITSLTIHATSGNDLLTIDFNNGNPIPTLISYNGNDGFDKIVLRGSAQVTNETITHTDAASGLIVFEPGGSQTTINFTGLEPIDDLIIVNGTYTISAPDVANEINIIDGPTIFGEQTFQVNSGATPTFELVNFANKKTVVIQGADSFDDVFTVFTTDGEAPDLILSLELVGNGSTVNGTSDIFVVRPSKDFPILVTGTSDSANDDDDYLFLDCANTGISPCPDLSGILGTNTTAIGPVFKEVTWSEIESAGTLSPEAVKIEKTITDFPDGAHAGDDDSGNRLCRHVR